MIILTQENPVNKMFDLHGRIALVTGAAGHLGTSMAKILAQAGATVILTGRNQEKLQKLSDAITKEEGTSVVIAIDVTDEKQIKQMFEEIASKYKKLDIIINNAYAGNSGSFYDATEVDFMSSYKIAVGAAYNIMKYANPLLKTAAQNRGGSSSIINIASMYGIVSPDHSIYGDSKENNPPYYGAAKAALIQLTRYAACQLAEDNIRVNCISPGPFPELKVITENPEFYRKLCDKVPMKRIGRSEELQGPLLFLASDASTYVTGVNLAVDGGWTSW